MFWGLGSLGLRDVSLLWGALAGMGPIVSVTRDTHTCFFLNPKSYTLNSKP